MCVLEGLCVSVSSTEISLFFLNVCLAAVFLAFLAFLSSSLISPGTIQCVQWARKNNNNNNDDDDDGDGDECGIGIGR